jgi:hypothetical protein
MAEALTWPDPPNANEAVQSVRKGFLARIVTQQNGQWHIAIFHEFDFPSK